MRGDIVTDCPAAMLSKPNTQQKTEGDLTTNSFARLLSHGEANPVHTDNGRTGTHLQVTHLVYNQFPEYEGIARLN